MISQTDSILAKLNFGPQFNIISNNSYAPVISGWGYDEIITNLRNVNALATVSQEIAGRRYRQNQYEAIRLQSQSAMNSGKISEQDLKKNVIGQYIITYGDWQQYNFNIEMLGLFKNEETILKKLAENGVYKQTEFLTFLVNLKQQELVSTRLKNQYQNDFALLNFICGIEDTSFIQLPDPNMSAETLPEFFNSIFYGQFIVDSLKLKNADKQIDFSYKPKINLLADGGYLSSLTYQPERNFGASVGISINIPLFNGTFRKLRHDKIAIEEQTRQYYRDFYINQYHQQINRFLQQLHANQKIKEQISVQIDYTQTLMNAYQKLLQTGDIRITDYMLAIGNYLTAKNLLVQNIIERYQIINELNYWNRTK
jgi:outer membrane protein TolC